MRLPRFSPRSVVSRLVVAIVCAAGPAGLHGQDTLKIPSSTTTPRAGAPAGTVLNRPPITVARPPAGTTAAGAGQQQLVRVPDVSGRTVDEARRLLAASGLEVGSVADGTGQGTPGTVSQQVPRAGNMVEPKSAVRLVLVPARQQPAITIRPPVTVPQQPAGVTVPRLMGRTTEDARRALAAAGLQPGAVTEVTGGGTPGTVVRQLPAAGSTAEPRSAVRLWVVPARVATQPRDTLVVVPNLAGRTRTDAQVALAAVGLRASGFGEAAGRGTPGTVARQQPAAGAAVARGSGVQLWLVPAQVAVVPDARNPPAQNPPVQNPPAQNPPAQNPPVQRPAAQDTAPRNPPAPDSAAPVFADSLIVPDVRRLALADARLSLQAAGLAAAFDAALADSATWMVRAQQPAPGARLAAGGVVALLLDPPAPAAAVATVDPDPDAGIPAPSTEPAAAPWYTRRPLWIVLAVVLLLAAVAGARRMRGGSRPPPIASVSARVRMDEPARVAVEGAPFAPGGLRFRMAPGRTAARVSPGGSLFANKEVSVDG
jgi:beta-lactam-binding protein with PASTA domain